MRAIDPIDQAVDEICNSFLSSLLAHKSKNDLTYTELAEETGVDRGRLVHLMTERGRGVMRQKESIKIGLALGIDLYGRKL